MVRQYLHTMEYLEILGEENCDYDELEWRKIFIFEVVKSISQLNKLFLSRLGVVGLQNQTHLSRGLCLRIRRTCPTGAPLPRILKTITNTSTYFGTK